MSFAFGGAAGVAQDGSLRSSGEDPGSVCCFSRLHSSTTARRCQPDAPRLARGSISTEGTLGNEGASRLGDYGRQEWSKLRSAGPLQMIKAADGSEVPVHGRNSSELVQGVPGRRRITFKASTLQQAVEGLAMYANAPIVDRTALRGEYDFELEYDAEQPTPRLDSAVGPPNPFTSMTCPILSTAIEHLGLKCESMKAPVRVLVIDSVQKPKEN